MIERWGIKLGLLLYLGFSIWSAGALFFCAGLWWMIAGIIIFLGAFGLAFCQKKAIWIGLAVNAGIWIWFGSLETRDDIEWQIHWRRQPNVVFYDENRFLLTDIRDFHYRSPGDFDIRYINGRFDLNKLETVDFALSYWDGRTNIGHTLLSFGFSDGQRLALSMETRLPMYMDQNAVFGIYKQYEIHCLWATETDIFKLRTNFRKDEFFLYRTNATPEQGRAILRHLLVYTAEVFEKSKFYNTVTDNCSTLLFPAVEDVVASSLIDYRVMINGRSDALAFENNWLAFRPGEDLATLKARRYANQYLEINKPYSEAIRTNML